MALRLAIAERRQISDDILIPVLSKMMLAERFDTDLYDKISRETNIDGKSNTLRELENSIAAQDDTGAVTAKPKKKTTASRAEKDETRAEENSLSEWSRKWVGLEPLLGDIDLRPYLFISRDRKALFSTSAGLPQMEAWVEKLCGERLEAKAIAVEIGKLPPGEAERYFNAVLARVRSAKDMKNRPAGVFGLIELCKVHPTLQSAVVALLNSLAPSKVGPWALTGWTEALTTDEAKQRFKAICESWAAQEENKALQVAAAATLKRSGK